ILILASEVLAAHPSLVSAAILVSILCSIIQVDYKTPDPAGFGNVGNTFPRLLNSEAEQKEDTGGHTPFSVIFLAREKK
ncbi:hypothetical protein N324_03595, partial [Chlamydotis macqueenii]